MIQIKFTLKHAVFLALIIQFGNSAVARTSPDTTPDGVPVQEWDSIFTDGCCQNIGAPLWDEIWDAIEKVGIFSFDVGDAENKIYIGRKVFDNRNSAGTWSVVDQIRMKTKLPLWQELRINGSRVLGFELGTIRNGLELTNIRIVEPKSYTSATHPRDRMQEITRSDWYKSIYSKDSTALPDSELVEKDGKPVARFFPGVDPTDPENRARKDKFKNIILFPKRLPLKAEDVQTKMEDGEIMAFTGQGSVSFGAGIGKIFELGGPWNRVVGGASVSAAIFGQYRIGVLRESERFVRVQVSRIGGTETRFELGTPTSKSDLLDGIFLIEKLDKHLDIIPFRHTITNRKYGEFALTYRFDLAQPEAIEAYELAIRGQLRMADDLAEVAENGVNNGNYSVTRIMEENSRYREKERKSRVKLGFLFGWDQKKKIKTVDTVLTFPNGEKHRYQAISESSKEYRALWGYHEKFNNRYIIDVDLDLYEKDPTNVRAISLVASGEIGDTHTNAKELKSYILESENQISQFGIYPRPKLKDKDRKKENGLLASSNSVEENPVRFISKPYSLGNSRFYYQLAFSNDHVQDFLSASEKERWETLEKVFDVEQGSWSSKRNYDELTPLNSPEFLPALFVNSIRALGGESAVKSAAKRIEKRWAIASEPGLDIRTRVQALAKLFSGNSIRYELLKVLRTRFDGQQVPFVTSGYSKVFGRIRVDGETEVRSLDVSSDRQKELDGERAEENQASDSGVHSISIVALPNGKYELNFNLNSSPDAIYIRVQAKRGFPRDLFGHKNGRIIVHNLIDRLVAKGGNSVILDPKDKASPWYSLAKAFDTKKANEFEVEISSNPDGLSWGATYAETVKFK